MFKGFRDFVLRGNVIDLAVAVVIGASFGAIVTALVDSLINPLIGLLFNADSLKTALVMQVGSANFAFGAIIAAIINFVLIAAVLYFCFVAPVNRFMAKRASGKHAPETEISLLTEIRDSLKK